MTKVIPCEIYSRVVGYFRPIHNWNNGKRAEFSDRIPYSVDVSMKREFSTAKNDAEDEEILIEEPAREQVSEIIVNVNGSTNVSSAVAGYKIYTLPGCSKCAEVKDFMNMKRIMGKEVNLKNSDGMDDFKEFYKNYRDKIKRGEDRTALLPIVALTDTSNSIVGIAQSLQEVKAYL